MEKEGKLSKEDVQGILKDQIDHALTTPNLDRINKTAEAQAYYECRQPVQTVQGRSAVVSPDVSNMVEAVLADISPAFCGDSLAEFEPMGEEDEPAAALESQFVSYMLMRKGRAYMASIVALKDACLARIGYVRVEIMKIEETENQTLQGVSALYLDDIINNIQPNSKLDTFEFEDSGDETEDGEKLFDATVKITKTSRRFIVRPVAPENMLVSGDCTTIDVSDAQFVAERVYLTKAELILMGAPAAVVETLQPITQDQNDAARKSRYDNLRPVGTTGEYIECFDCFIRIDIDGNNRPKLQRDLTDRNGVILIQEATPCIPIAAGAIMIAGHEHSAVSLYDKLKQVQDSKTSGLRQYLDNMSNNNNRQKVVVEGEVVNMDAVTAPMPGGAIIVRSPDAIREMDQTDIGTSSQMFLDYMDRVRSESGGSSLDMQGAQAQIMGETARGIDRQYTAKEKLSAYFHRNFSETLVYSMYLIAHKMLRTHWQQQISMKTGNGWQSANPAQWPERDAVSPKQSKRKSEAVGGVLQIQQTLMEAGFDGVLVDDTKIYNSITDMARAGDIANPDQYYINPASDQAKQAKEGKQKQAQEQQKAMQQMQQQLITVQGQIKQIEVLADRANKMNELAYKYWSDILKSEVDEAKIVGSATASLQQTQLAGTMASAASDAEATSTAEGLTQ